MDAAGFTTAHLVGNSLGGYIAFQRRSWTRPLRRRLRAAGRLARGR